MARSSFRQSVLAGYVSASLVCAVGYVAYRSAETAVDMNASAGRTRALAASVHSVSNAVRDAESLQRGFLLTGEVRYLAPFHNATEATREGMAHVRAMAPDKPHLMPRVDSLGYFVGLKIAELDETVRLRREMGMRAAAAVIRSERSGEPMIEVERLLDSLDLSLGRSAASGAFQVAAQERLVIFAIASAALLAALLALTVNRLHTRGAREQQRITDELDSQSHHLQLQAAELETTSAERDTTTRELVQHTVKAEFNETRLAGILGSATDAIVSFDDERKIVYFNAAAERLFGEPPDALTGAPIMDFVATRSNDAFEQRMVTARRAAHSNVVSPELSDTLICRSDGSEIPVEVSMAYARSWRQGLFTAVLRDVSGQRQMEEEFRQAQKMEAVGRLAGGIAHDFNNLLTVIGASSDFLLQDINGDARELAQDIKEIKRATDRAASLTRQLLTFSRRQLVKPQLLDLNSVVSEMETMLRRLIGEDVTLATDYGDDMGFVRLDRGQLEQVVVNLVVNARDAMQHGGAVNLRTGSDRRVAPAGAVHACGISDWVTLSVSDTGSGMDERTRAHIFEPFFTTKDQGRGTGLGLSTVYGIVTQAGGDIVVTSERDVGTKFTIFLPTSEEPVATAPAAVPSSDTLRGSETVLVVEDEEPLRRLTRRILESRGYAVLEAANGSDAIAAMAQSPTRVDLVLSDVVMPGMGGRELVERLTPVYPWLRVLFMSGYTEDMMLHHRVAELGVAVLEKPFTRDDLARAVRNVLDQQNVPPLIAGIAVAAR
ncbi:MAG: ATP-binding protein [Gemmatimonadaceae bacterium]